MGTHLTERVVKAAEIGSRKYVVFDEDCPGFGLCVFESGRKGFVLIYRAAGRQRRMTVGTWPSWSVTAARDEAKRLKRDIDRGEGNLLLLGHRDISAIGQPGASLPTSKPVTENPTHPSL